MNFLKTSVLITKKVPESGTPSKYVSHTIPKPHTKFHALDQPVTIFPTYSLAIEQLCVTCTSDKAEFYCEQGGPVAFFFCKKSAFITSTVYNVNNIFHGAKEWVMG